jgi:hypothetical protein
MVRVEGEEVELSEPVRQGGGGRFGDWGEGVGGRPSRPGYTAGNFKALKSKEVSIP